MPSPFQNAIKGTTAGTPGTGAFTPNAAASGFRPWSPNVSAGWIGLVRYDDGPAWELQYSCWNGTTLSRGTNQFYDSSTGSPLSLSSSATAHQVADADEVMSSPGGQPWRGWQVQPGGTTIFAEGISLPTANGTAASAGIVATNFLTLQPRIQYTSATTASAQAGWSASLVQGVVSTTAGQGGIEYRARWGATALPTGPRLFAGLTSISPVSATEASSLVGNIAAFALDSTDTNIQLLTNNNSGGGTKIDTGIPLVANGWYETTIRIEPGSTQVAGLIKRMDTGAIWFGKTSTDVPVNGALLAPDLVAGLNATNTGTAIVLHCGSMFIRSSF